MRIKKIIYTIATALLISFACASIHSQSSIVYKFEKANGSKYSHGINLRKLHKYEDVFSTHPQSHFYFNNFNKNRIKAKRWGLTSLGLILATPILNSRVLPEGYVDPDPAFLLAVLMSSSLAILTGSAAIVFKLKSSAAKSNAISIYNDDITNIRSQADSPTPSIVINNNGLGFLLSF